MCGPPHLNFLYSTTHFTLSLQNMLDINLWRCMLLKYTLDSKYYSLLIDFKLNAKENLELELYIKNTRLSEGIWFLFMRAHVNKQNNEQTDIRACTRNNPSRLSVCVHLYPRWLMYHPFIHTSPNNQPGDPFYVEWSFVWAVLVW